jgi:hypothetical protein
MFTSIESRNNIMVQRCNYNIALAPDNALFVKQFDKLGTGSPYELISIYGTQSLKC